MPLLHRAHPGRSRRQSVIVALIPSNRFCPFDQAVGGGAAHCFLSTFFTACRVRFTGQGWNNRRGARTQHGHTACLRQIHRPTGFRASEHQVSVETRVTCHRIVYPLWPQHPHQPNADMSRVNARSNPVSRIAASIARRQTSRKWRSPNAGLPANADIPNASRRVHERHQDGMNRCVASHTPGRAVRPVR